MVDTGLMRKMNLNIHISFKKRYRANVKLIDASKIYFQKLEIFMILKKKKNNWEIIY